MHDENFDKTILTIAQETNNKITVAAQLAGGSDKIPKKALYSIILDTVVEIESAASSYTATTDYIAKIFEATKRQNVFADSISASVFAVSMSIYLILKTNPNLSRNELLNFVEKSNNFHNSFANSIYNISQIAGAFAPGNLAITWPVIAVTALVFVTSFVIAAGSTKLLNDLTKSKEEIWELGKVRKAMILMASGYEGANIAAGMTGVITKFLSLVFPSLRGITSGVYMPLAIGTAIISGTAKTAMIGPNLFESQSDSVFVGLEGIKKTNKLENKINTIEFFMFQLALLAVGCANGEYLFPILAIGLQILAISIASGVKYKNSNQDTPDLARLLTQNSIIYNTSSNTQGVSITGGPGTGLIQPDSDDEVQAKEDNTIN